jgi:hypothetical protein
VKTCNLLLAFVAGLSLAACSATEATPGPGCPSGAADCAGTCLQVDRDRLNCGACGASCGAGEICSDGVCGLTCPEASALCDEACVDLLNDTTHCGACGNACADGLTCRAGACDLVCAGGTTVCSDRCIDPLVDPANCGACGEVCAEGLSCRSGACELACAGGTAACGDGCVNTDNDPEHCGACDTACAAAESCVAGQCARVCLDDTVLCADTCVHTDHNPEHCGACDTACAAAESCVAGQCARVCLDDTVLCADTCVHTDHNPEHCGACGNACDAGQICADGNCATACPAGTTQCGDLCVDTGGNPAHCGACDAACPTPERTLAVCGAGVCGTRCEAGFGDCNNDEVDGCEIDLESELAHCGACGAACPDPENALPACVDSACGLGQCLPGFANCDAEPGNGCEVVTATDSAHCGACGQACADDEVCSDGGCVDAAPPACRVVAGINWCYHGSLCGQACNATCQAHGLQPLGDNTAWFNLQNTELKCTAIGSAFGLGIENMANYTHACTETASGNQNGSPQPAGTLLCSTFSGCPASHRTQMDDLGVACDAASSRVSICPCE